MERLKRIIVNTEGEARIEAVAESDAAQEGRILNERIAAIKTKEGETGQKSWETTLAESSGISLEQLLKDLKRSDTK